MTHRTQRIKRIFSGFCAAALLSASFGFEAGAMLTAEDKIAQGLQKFSAIDLEGNEVTQDIFADKDITMVNVWGTFCSPCIGEMPDLAELSDSLPENMQLVGLIIDVADENDENFETAKQIVEKSGADFTHIIAGEDMAAFVESIEGVPTTFFVDKDGKILGDEILGADVEAYKERIEEYKETFPEKDSADE
ncbi:MAG: TlpA disulfide reductase family protein [Eubacteriales bacterium]|nr:TlpA disulfide reductase family protein [Eubacteriales bacterium]